MNLTLATVSVVVIQYNDTNITTSSTIYPVRFLEGNYYLSPRSALITTVKTTIAGTGRYNPPTPDPTSLVQATTIPRTAGAPPPRQTLSVVQELGPTPPIRSPDLFGVPTDSPKLLNNPEVLPPNPPGVAKNSPDLLGDQAITRPSFTASQGAYNPVNLVPVLTIHGSTYQADQDSRFTIDDQTITPGGAITAYGTPIAIDTGASIAVIGSSTQSLSNTVVTPKPLLTFAGTTYTADDTTNFVIAGETLTRGGILRVDGTRLSLDQAGTGVVIGTSTSLLISPDVNTAAAAPALTFGGSTYTAGPSSDFVLNGQTLTKGGIITLDGTQVAYNEAGTNVVIGTSTYPLAFPGTTAVTKPVLTFDGSTYTVDSLSNFPLDDQTLAKGGSITVHGTQLSYDEAGIAVVIGSSTQLLSPATIAAAAEPILTFDGSTYVADSSSNFDIDGQTLTRGSSITVHGTQLSYDEAGTAVVIGSSTEILSLATITAAPEPILTFDGSTYVADSSSNFLIDGQILSKGDMITVDGTKLYYDQAGTDVVIGSSTQMLSTTSIAAAEEPAITFDGSTYYANSASDFIIDGQTLTRGGVITVQGTPISYAAGGTDVVVGTSTEAVGLKGGVITGFGVSSSTPSIAVQFTGEAQRQYSASWAMRFMLGVLAAFLLL